MLNQNFLAESCYCPTPLFPLVQSVVLTGTGMSAVAADNTVMLGATKCQRLIVSKRSSTDPTMATQLSCGVPVDSTAGRRAVSVHVAGKGYAQGNLTVTLDTLAVTSWTPGARPLSAVGMTTFTPNGKGFDPTVCNRNWVWVGGVRCFVVGCTKATITALYPGGTPNEAATVEVWVESDDGSFDPVTSKRSAPWTLNVTAPGAGGYRVAGLLSDPALPVEGGTIRFRVEGLTTSNVNTWSIRLLPLFDAASLNFTDSEQLTRVNTSLSGQGITCGSAVAEAPDVASCRLRVVPPGQYVLAVTADGATHILQPNTSEPAGSSARGILSSAFGLFSVSPSRGSIGGGTVLTLSGRGFAALQPATAVVVIKVRCSSGVRC